MYPHFRTGHWHTFYWSKAAWKCTCGWAWAARWAAQSRAPGRRLRKLASLQSRRYECPRNSRDHHSKPLGAIYRTSTSTFSAGATSKSHLGSRIPDLGSWSPDSRSRVRDLGSRTPDLGSRIHPHTNRAPDNRAPACAPELQISTHANLL